MELVKEIVVHWRRDRQYREAFMESADAHIGRVREQPVRWLRMAICIFFGFSAFWDAVGCLAVGVVPGAVVNGLFCSLFVFGFSSMLNLSQMLKTAHEDALKNSKVQ